MKTFLLDLIPKIKKYSQRLDDITIITGKHWVLLDGDNTKTVYIFRESNNQLLISKNGRIEKGTWEHIGNESLIIDIKKESFLFKHGFIDDTVLALKVDGTDEYALFINEVKFEGLLNSIDKALSFLKENYLLKTPQTVPDAVKVSLERKREYETTLSLEDEKAIKTNDFNVVEEISEGLYVIIDWDLNFGYANENLEKVIDTVYEFAGNFKDGLALVRLNGKFGFIDRRGKEVIPLIYDNAENFRDGRAKVRKGRKTFYINIYGKVL